MRKALLGVAAIGALVAARRAMGRAGRRMRQRCEQLMAHGGRPSAGGT